MQINAKATDRWHREIEPFIEYADLEENRGFKSRVAEDFTDHNWPVVRQMISQWMTGNRNNRVEPSAGNGLLLLESCLRVWERLEKERKSGRRPPTRSFKDGNYGVLKGPK